MYASEEIEFSCNKAIEQKATKHFDVLFHYFSFYYVFMLALV